jgi:hypothetical protein
MKTWAIAVAAASGAVLAGALLYSSGVFITERATAAPEQIEQPEQIDRQGQIREIGPNEGRVPAYGPAYANAGCPCCNKRSGQSSSPAQEAQRLASVYYTQVYGDRDFTVEVEDFGCHQEATILKNGKFVKLLSISNGDVREVEY